MIGITKPKKVSIQAITWNLGNTRASDLAVDGLIANLYSTDSLPDVLCVSTQEEFASDQKRLQQKLLDKLNHGIKDKAEQYVLVETQQPQYHTTTAGANKSPKVFVKAMTTRKNRVSCALLVKKPLHFSEAEACIDFQGDKEFANKSIITISGKLKSTDGHVIQLVISGGHWDSKSESSRRALSNLYLFKQGLKSSSFKSFHDIVNEAQVFRLMMGDFNQRDLLMKDDSAVDSFKNHPFVLYGFDVSQRPSLLTEHSSLPASYGLVCSQGDITKGFVQLPDPRKRPGAAKAGFLDRIAYSWGLPVESSYLTSIDDQLISTQKNNVYYDESDHLPVSRTFMINMPTRLSRHAVVAEYIKHRLPDFSDGIKRLQYLIHNANDNISLLEHCNHFMPHDSTIEPIQWLKSLAHEDRDEYDFINMGLLNRLQTKLMLQQQIADLNKHFLQVVSDENSEYLELSFNVLSTLNTLKEAQDSILSVEDKQLSPSHKLMFKEHSELLLDRMYSFVFGCLTNIHQEPIKNYKITSAACQKMIHDHPILFAEYTVTLHHVQDTLSKPELKNILKPKPIEQDHHQPPNGLFFRRLMSRLRHRLESMSIKKQHHHLRQN